MKQPVNIVKIGGNVINDPAALDAFLADFAALPGFKVLIHGGGREATRLSKAMGITTTMIDGRRVTDAETLKVVTMVYAGLINKSIVASLQTKGCDAAGFSGADGHSIRSVRRSPVPHDFGYVGDVPADGVNVDFFTAMFNAGITPVMCAITCDSAGQLLNTNADSVATAVASALSAAYETTLTFCFEMPGVMADVNDPASVISVITPDTFERLKADGTVSDGMIPKLTGALNAVKSGVRRVIITSRENLSDPAAGTKIELR